MLLDVLNETNWTNKLPGDGEQHCLVTAILAAYPNQHERFLIYDRIKEKLSGDRNASLSVISQWNDSRKSFDEVRQLAIEMGI